MTAQEEMCACGLPLHYSNPDSEAAVRHLIDLKGEYVPITIRGAGTWLVQRHYIALHGISGWELPGSQWEKVG